EYFRDQEHLDVLLFIDNIFRFVQAGSEVSALLGRMPSAVGYQPNLNTEIGELQERITSTKSGSITSVQAIYVPADDYTDPAPAATFAHLDATTNLSRQIVERARKIEKFLSQPMFVAAQFTGLEGKYVKIDDTVRSFKEIVEGKYDDVPEQAFYMVGTIDEALEKADKMKTGV